MKKPKKTSRLWHWAVTGASKAVWFTQGRLTRGAVNAHTRSEARAAIKDVLDIERVPSFIIIY